MKVKKTPNDTLFVLNTLLGDVQDLLTWHKRKSIQEYYNHIKSIQSKVEKLHREIMMERLY
jgi:hypothetical protein